MLWHMACQHEGKTQTGCAELRAKLCRIVRFVKYDINSRFKRTLIVARPAASQTTFIASCLVYLLSGRCDEHALERMEARAVFSEECHILPPMAA